MRTLYTREDGGLIGDVCRWIYSLAVRIHASVYLTTRTPMGERPFDCDIACEVVADDCACIPAPFTGTPYDPNSEED